MIHYVNPIIKNPILLIFSLMISLRYPEISKPCIQISRDQDLFLLDFWKFRNLNPLNSIFFEIFIFENKIDFWKVRSSRINFVFRPKLNKIYQVIFLVKTSVVVSVCWFLKICLRKWQYFGAKEFYFTNFDFRNGCRNKFQDHDEKLWSWFRNRHSLKIDFANVWTHESISTAEELSVAQGFLIRRFFQNDFKVFRINDQKS